MLMSMLNKEVVILSCRAISSLRMMTLCYPLQSRELRLERVYTKTDVFWRCICRCPFCTCTLSESGVFAWRRGHRLCYYLLFMEEVLFCIDSWTGEVFIAPEKKTNLWYVSLCSIDPFGIFDHNLFDHGISYTISVSYQHLLRRAVPSNDYHMTLSFHRAISSVRDQREDRKMKRFRAIIECLDGSRLYVRKAAFFRHS